ncbi:hypothetical protein BDV96DRAFT_35464 [Lophiotrema nucula]|uniref:Uncharacterized protein n=1 Tax=Lophiotrema nucula TaxID=690887 RepID=A0A6A5ZBI3_9PLEO|nr:hypothetical protein BDV96DRAFT_35464 [Lophiotrema nucula]
MTATERQGAFGYIDFAADSRRVRARWQGKYCTAQARDQDIECYSTRLLPLLHHLQHAAFPQVRVNVLRAVGRRLPAEMTEMIISYTLAAEEQPLDPRILIKCRNRSAGETATRLVKKFICPECKTGDYNENEWEEISPYVDVERSSVRVTGARLQVAKDGDTEEDEDESMNESDEDGVSELDTEDEDAASNDEAVE